MTTPSAILLRLGRAEASISELAGSFEMTLTGLKKHISVLEGAGLVTTEKVGRVRTCKLGPRRLDEATKWLTSYRSMLEQRLDHLDRFLGHNERNQGKP